ncbi:hypothetical protein, partial [Thiolapillus sp.]|uniref:hypothetical protein n=1 Tax=Thiolapillus sp. TaxID=2017437 RepID=UPI003AF741F7
YRGENKMPTKKNKKPKTNQKTKQNKKATKNRVVGGGGGEINRAKQLNSIHHQKACNKTKKVK